MTELSREEVLEIAKGCGLFMTDSFGTVVSDKDAVERFATVIYEACAKSERAVSDRLLEALKDASADLRGYDNVEDSAQRDRLIAEVEAMRKENG